MMPNDIGRWLQTRRGSTLVTTLEGPAAAYHLIESLVQYIIRILNFDR